MCESCAQPNEQRVILALGANLGHPLEQLEQACDLLAEEYGDLRLSQLYETSPVNCPADSPNYLNACIEIRTTQSPETLLKHCQAIETKLGRQRSGIYGEARSCDIDIINYGSVQMSNKALTLPHPRAHERAFVLQPLCDIDPQLKLAGQRKTAQELLQSLPPSPEHTIRPFDL
ncbi:MAG: 2-amino-4-hydroxy-6-hydroxymethyldihydropteridine diphosphokinase [Akkermansia sp.]